MRANVTISLVPESGADLRRAAEKIRASGVKIDRVLPRLLIILGSVEEALIDKVRSLPEVRAVEEDHPLYPLDTQSRERRQV
jgi:hypothetical protein